MCNLLILYFLFVLYIIPILAAEWDFLFSFSSVYIFFTRSPHTWRDVTEEWVLECAPNLSPEGRIFSALCQPISRVFGIDHCSLFDAHFAHVMEHLINILRVDFLLIFLFFLALNYKRLLPSYFCCCCIICECVWDRLFLLTLTLAWSNWFTIILS